MGLGCKKESIRDKELRHRGALISLSLLFFVGHVMGVSDFTLEYGVAARKRQVTSESPKGIERRAESGFGVGTCLFTGFFLFKLIFL
jgi:hypothetical protein